MIEQGQKMATELTAYVLIEGKPFAIDLNIKPNKPNRIHKDIVEEIKKETSEEFQVLYVKYKRLNYKNMELYIFFKSKYFREELLKQQKEYLQEFGYQKTLILQMEMHSDITKEFDNILIKYRFEKD